MVEALPIEWRGVERVGAVEALIRRESARLAAWSGSPKVWKVTIDAGPQRPAPDVVCVRVEVRAPERQVIVNRAHADARVAVRDAFDDVFRKFERRVLRDRRGSRALRLKEVLAA
jgi:hypothetical protein